MSNLRTKPQSKKRGGQPGNRNAVKSDDQTKPKSDRKRGAPFGNKNAQTHGFYASRLNHRSFEGLDQIGVNSLKDEIDVMRIFSRKVAELGDDIEDLDEAKSILNTLSNSTSTINRLVRTNTYIPNPEDSTEEVLRQALLELEEEWPEFKKFGDKFRTPEQIAELDARIAARQAREEEARLRGEFVDKNGIPYPVNTKNKKKVENENEMEGENDQEGDDDNIEDSDFSGIGEVGDDPHLTINLR